MRLPAAEPPAEVRRLAASWGLTDLQAADARYSSVWFARQGHGHVVLKVGTSAARSREAAALAGYRAAGSRAVPVLLAHDPESGALLIERVLLGADLRPVALRDDDSATAVAGELMRRLGTAALPRPAGLPDLLELSETLDVARHRATRGDRRIPMRLIDAASSLLADLCLPASPPSDAKPSDANPSAAKPGVVHGDLHHGNILRRGFAPLDSVAGEWVAIDPHGWWGDRTADVAMFLLNPGDVLAAHRDPAVLARRRGQILADTAGFALQRVLSWAVVGAVVSESWLIEDHGFVAGAPLRLAEGLVGAHRSARPNL